jgi:hypothetical protein
VTESYLQTVVLEALAVTVGFGFTDMITLFVDEQMFVPVPVTVYTVVTEGQTTVVEVPPPDPPLQE